MAQQIEWNNLPGGTVAQLLGHGDLGVHACRDAYQELIDRIEAETPGEVVLDFSAVNSVSSMGLQRLLKLKEKVASRGGSLRLCNVADHVHEVFVLARLARYFGLHHQPKLRRRTG